LLGDVDARVLVRAGVNITALPGCCGLVGNFGFEEAHCYVSL
jgi:hypothetical protein